MIIFGERDIPKCNDVVYHKGKSTVGRYTVHIEKTVIVLNVTVLEENFPMNKEKDYQNLTKDINIQKNKLEKYPKPRGTGCSAGLCYAFY